MKVWEECEHCDEYVCNYHKEHAHDCSCPGIGVWAGADLWPYEDELTPEIEKWIDDNPIEEEVE